MDAVAAIAEVLAWVALATAALFAIMGGALRLVRGGWESSPAVVADGQLRWMSADGEFYTSDGWPAHPSTDDFVIYYRTRRPEVAYPERVAHDERTNWVVAIVTTAIAVVGFVVSTIAPLF